jgi:hypothetical protein
MVRAFKIILRGFNGAVNRMRAVPGRHYMGADRCGPYGDEPMGHAAVIRGSRRERPRSKRGFRVRPVDKITAIHLRLEKTKATHNPSVVPLN